MAAPVQAMPPPASDGGFETSSDDFEDTCSDASVPVATRSFHSTSVPVATRSFHSTSLPASSRPRPPPSSVASPSSAVEEDVVVRFLQPRLGIFFADTKLGDVIIRAVEPHSEAAGQLRPGMVITHVAGSPLPRRSMPKEAVVALLKQKSARPLTLAFTTRVRRADMPRMYQTQLRRVPPPSGAAAPPARLLRPVGSSNAAQRKKTGLGRPLAKLGLCGRPTDGSATAGTPRPAGVSKNEWRLALDASDLLVTRRFFNRYLLSRSLPLHRSQSTSLRRPPSLLLLLVLVLIILAIVWVRWREEYVTSTLSEVFTSRWNHRLLVRTIERWTTAVEEALSTSWLLGLSLSRWRNPLAHAAFRRWLRNVAEARQDGFCAEYLGLSTEERRERALEEPGWHFDSRAAEAAQEEKVAARRERLESLVPARGVGAAAQISPQELSRLDSEPEPEPEPSDDDATEEDEGPPAPSHAEAEDPAGAEPSNKPARPKRKGAGGAQRAGAGSTVGAESGQGWFASFFSSVPCCVAP